MVNPVSFHDFFFVVLQNFFLSFSSVVMGGTDRSLVTSFG